MERETSRTHYGNTLQIDMDSIVRDIIRQWWVILLAALAAAFTLSAVVKLTWEPKYATTTTFIIGQSGLTTDSYSSNLRSAETLTENFELITESSLLHNRVCSDLGITSYDADIRFSVVEKSNLMTMSVESESPRMAYLISYSIVNCMEELYKEFSDSTTIQIIQNPILPTKPSNQLSIRPLMKKAALGAALLMILLFALLSYRKDTVKNENDIKNKIDARLLGTLYHENKYHTFRSLLKGDKCSLRVDDPLTGFGYMESVKLIATRIRKEMDTKGYKTVLFTSVSENEGKSTAAANVALAMSQEGYRVILVDCDFRKPSQYKIFDLRDKTDDIQDLGDTLLEKGQLKTCTVGLEKKLSAVLSLHSHRHLLGAGGSDTLKKALDQLAETADYILLDSSPMGIIAEGEILAKLADSTIVVIRQDQMEARFINDTIDMLEKTGKPVMGCIFNNVRPGILNTILHGGNAGRYGYGYGYGYYGKYGYGHYGAYDKNRKGGRKH